MNKILSWVFAHPMDFLGGFLILLIALGVYATTAPRADVILVLGATILWVWLRGER